jgi:hypothetical protein
MEFKKSREAYAYPTVGLRGTVAQHAHTAFATSSQLDHYHHQLLRSNEDDCVLMGYLSVLYWGHYSGSNGRTNAARALSKVRTAINGANFLHRGQPRRRRGLVDFAPGEAVGLIRQAIRLVDAGDFAGAIRVLCELPQLQFAFASKVVAFLAPDKCGVIDSVIARKFTQYGFKLRAGYVSLVKENFEHYQRYCIALSTNASQRNEKGEGSYWRDRNGQAFPWRAIDVERAMYSLQQ